MSLVNNRPEDHESSSSDEDDLPQEPTSTCMRQLGAHQINRVTVGMQHAVDCLVLGHDCKFDLCWKMKYVLQHTRLCEKRRRQDCAVCNQVIAIIVFHGAECELARCQVPFCRNVKAMVAEYPAGHRFGDMDHLTNMVIQSLRDLPGVDEEREQGMQEPEGLLAEDECRDLVVPPTD